MEPCRHEVSSSEVEIIEWQGRDTGISLSWGLHCQEGQLCTLKGTTKSRVAEHIISLPKRSFHTPASQWPVHLGKWFISSPYQAVMFWSGSGSTQRTSVNGVFFFFFYFPDYLLFLSFTSLHMAGDNKIIYERCFELLWKAELSKCLILITAIFLLPPRQAEFIFHVSF